jgi:hypothetical protein
MFLSYEISKGEASFWFPYLRILPVPGTISNWTHADLSELQVRTPRGGWELNAAIGLSDDLSCNE